MQQPPDAPINQRLRTIRRRIAAAVLATFVAAWLAVAAFGKGGDASTTAATSTTPSQSDDGSNSSSTQSDDDSSSSQGAQAGPVTSSQS
jgi:hypothetical protein